MVLQVAADARQVAHHGDAHRGELVGGPDAGQEEELGRVDHAGAQHDLACRVDLHGCAVTAVLDAGDPRPVAQEPGRERAGLDDEVGSRHRGTQVRMGRCPA